MMKNTNSKAPMQEGNEKGKNKIMTNQSISMAPENEIEMLKEGVSSTNDSMHKPKGVNKLRYYAGFMELMSWMNIIYSLTILIHWENTYAWEIDTHM